jgi:two-component system, OmpR family, phosphate regulon sensor histidine kinase PhoR
MKNWSLVKRWVVYQATIVSFVLIITFSFTEKLVHLGVGAGIKASVEILKPSIIKLSTSDLKSYFLKNQPPFVGLYDPDGKSVYLPEDDLPSNISEIKTSTSLFQKKYLLYVERLDNGFYLLGFTSQERMYYIEQYITKTMIILMSLMFIISSYIAYLILKKLYLPVEKLSQQMNLTLEEMQPISLPENFKEDPKIVRLIDVYNQLILTIKNQFSRLDKKQKQLKQILETLEEGILLISENQNVDFVNSQASFYLKSKSHLHNLEVLSHSDLGEKIKGLIAPLIKKPLKEKFEDTGRFYELTLKNILDTQQLVVIYDETDRIEKLESGKTFISNASHELRTPITIIKGFAEALCDEEAVKHVKIEEVMPKILSACDRMDALIKRLLLLADVDQRTIELNAFDLGSCLIQEVSLFKNLDPKSKIFYDGPTHYMVKGDEDLLKIVFSNLLSNSLKYSQDPKEISIHLITDKDLVEIRFKDNGIGIPSCDLDKVFERFYRVDKARTRKMGGAGLGLSLVKTIIDKHRGTISVESELGQGSCFIVRLPLL